MLTTVPAYTRDLLELGDGPHLDEEETEDEDMSDSSAEDASPFKYINPAVTKTRLSRLQDGCLARKWLFEQIAVVISDESHLMTNELTDGARALDICVGAGSKILLMSGTPIQNSVNDLGN